MQQAARTRDGGQPLPMVTKLACRNLLHDRLSLIVALMASCRACS